jgi:hypothetical protein
MTGVPLLPTSWAKGLKGHYFEVHRRKTTISSLSILCSNSWNLGWTKDTTPVEFALKQIHSLSLTHGIEDLIELPAVEVRIADIRRLESIPFLTTTWLCLDANQVDMESFARILACGSFADVLKMTNDMAAALDIAITTAEWVNDRGRVIAPAKVEGVRESFELAQIRHVLQSGFPLPKKDVDARWIPALSHRIGLSLDGEARTLEFVGREIGLTRERVRQIEQRFNPAHTLIRRWPQTSTIVNLEEVLRANVGSLLKPIDSQLRELSSDFGESPTDAALNLLRISGHEIEANVSNGFLEFGTPAQVKALPSGSLIKTTANKLAGSMGFIRLPDLMPEIQTLYPDLSKEMLLHSIRKALPITDLPFDYLFTRSVTTGTIVGITRRMLACTNPLPIELVHQGISRRARWRKIDPPPPIPVLEDFFSRIPNFSVTNGLVATTDPSPPEPGSVIGWTVNQVIESGLGAISRTVMLEAARTSGFNQTSVAIYCQFDERLIRLPQSCIGVVGEIPDPALIEIAAEQGRLISVTTRISYKNQGANPVLDVLVGNSCIDSGTLSVRTSLRSRIGNSTMPIFFDGVQHGSIGVSGNLLYGFSSTFNSANTRVGDVIRLTFDFTNDQIIVSEAFDDESD